MKKQQKQLKAENKKRKKEERRRQRAEQSGSSEVEDESVEEIVSKQAATHGTPTLARPTPHIELEPLKLKTVLHLKKHPNVAKLSQQYALKVHNHPKYLNLVQLSYKTRESPMSSAVVQECRGLVIRFFKSNLTAAQILDSTDDWKVISFPFSKFFNEGEPNAISIDWTSCIKTKKPFFPYLQNRLCHRKARWKYDDALLL